MGQNPSGDAHDADRISSDDPQDVDKTGGGDAQDVDKTGGGDAHDADKIGSDDAQDVDKTGGGDAHDADKTGSDDAHDVDKTGGGDAHDADKIGSGDAHDVGKTGGGGSPDVDMTCGRAHDVGQICSGDSPDVDMICGRAHDVGQICSGDSPDVDMICGRAHDVGQICSGDSPDVDMICGRAHDVGQICSSDSPDVDMICGRAHDVGQTCSSDSPDVDMTCGRAHDVGQTCSGDSPDVDMICGRAHDVGQTCSSNSPDVDMTCCRAHDVGQTCSSDSPDVDMICGRAHDVGQTCSSDSPDVDMICGRAHDVGQTCSGDSPDVDMTCCRAHDVGQTCSGDSPDVDMTCRDGGHDVGKTLNNDTHDVDKTYECHDVCDKSVDETLVGKTPSKDSSVVVCKGSDSQVDTGDSSTDGTVLVEVDNGSADNGVVVFGSSDRQVDTGDSSTDGTVLVEVDNGSADNGVVVFGSSDRQVDTGDSSTDGTVLVEVDNGSADNGVVVCESRNRAMVASDNGKGYVRSLSDGSWYIYGSIGAETVEWLIDSGAGPSLLDYGVYRALDPEIRPDLLECVTNLLAAAGAPLKVYGQIAVEVKFGKTEFVIPLVVTDLGGLQGILGNMFIRSAEDVEFDLRRGTMSMGSEVYYLHERAGEGDCFVRLEQVVEVPGNHEVQVVGRVSPNWPLATRDRGLVEAARDFSCSRDCPSGSGEGCGTQGPGNGVETTEYVGIAARTLSDARDQVVGDALANDVVACIWDQEKGTQELGTHLVVGNVDGTCNPLTEQEVQIDLERQSVLENDIIVGCDPLQSQGDCCHATQVDSSSQRDPGPMMKKRVVLRTSESDAMTTKEPEHRKRKLGRHKDQLCDGFGLCSRPHERDRPTELRPKVMTVTDQAGGRPPDQSKECNGFNIWSNTDLHGPQKDDLANPDTGGIKTSAGQQRRHPWNHH